MTLIPAVLHAPLFLTLIVLVPLLLGGAYHLGTARRTKEYRRLEDLASGQLDEALEEWLRRAGKSTTDGAICRHLAKHVNELFTEVNSSAARESWAASARNLLDMYEAHHDIEQSAELRLGRMMLKYSSDPANHTPMPADVKALSHTQETLEERDLARRAAEAAARRDVYRYSGS